MTISYYILYLLTICGHLSIPFNTTSIYTLWSWNSNFKQQKNQ